jgi:SAM-dependent methyltransferase
MESFFGTVPLKGRRILDIGGGFGLLSLYAVCCGAREAICIEPESAGVQTSDSEKTFTTLCEELGIQNARFVPETFQEYCRAFPDSFDVVCSCNSINHLDEAACISLLTNPASRAVYDDVFRQISKLTVPGSQVIIVDCSPHNVFARIGIRNPFAPTIEWHKHQAPETWAALLGEAGFAKPHISWLTFNGLGRTGRMILGHKNIAYMLRSHFRLEMHRTSSHPFN